MNAHRGDRQPAALDAGRLTARRRRPGAPEDPVQLRRLGLGVLLAADDRRPPGGGRAPAATRTRLPGASSIAEQGSPRCTSSRRCSQAFLRGARRRRAAARCAAWSAAARRCPASWPRRFAARCPRAELHNLYGPTEAAVDVTCLGLRRRGARPRRCPIGRPDRQHPHLRARRARCSRCRSACRASCTSAACRPGARLPRAGRS